MPDPTTIFPISEVEAAAFRGPPSCTPAQLIEQGGRVLTAGPRNGQPWRHDDAPYLVFPMDAYAWPSVREMIVAGGNQVAKTTLQENCLSYVIARAPSNNMLVMQDEGTCNKRMRDNIMPMVRQTPYLAELRPDSKHDEATQRIAFANGAILYSAWGTAESSTETWTIEYLFCDEPDFWPAKTGDLDRIRKRCETFPHTRKILITCKPMRETGPTWTAYQAADVRYRPHATCLRCTQPFPFTWQAIQYPADTPRATIRRERLARLVCPHCHHPHDDRAKDDAVRLACAQKTFWQPDVQLDRPVAIAFHMPSWISSFVSLSPLAYEWISANDAKRKGNIEPLKTFITARKAEPWVEHRAPRDTDAIMILREDRPRGAVPVDAVALAAGIDTQDHGLYYVIRAATNPEPRALSTHLVREGYIHGPDDFPQLQAILFDHLYTDTTGSHRFVINLALQDAMGHRTEEVYAYLLDYAGIWVPIQGHQKQARPHYYSTIETYPDSNRPIPGGIQLLHLNVTHYQNGLDRALRIPVNDPGAVNMHQDIAIDYANQMVVCYRDDNDIWIHPKGKPDHYWSCETYCRAAFDKLGARFWMPDHDVAPQPPVKNPQTRPPKNRQRMW